MRLTPSSTCGLLVSFLAISVTTAQPALESEHKGVTTHSEADTGPVDPSQPGVSMPLDVDNYPSAPPGLELQQVHVYVRHGERTPVGIRMSDPPASIPEHWMMCKTARRFRAAVSAAPLGAPEGVFGAGVGKGAPAGAEAVVGGGVADGDTLRMRKTVERADGTSAEGECLLGELTDIGRQNTYNYGTALRKLYVDKLGFLPDTTRSAGETYFRSTNMPRTIESLQHIVHGLYPTSKCENEALTQILIRNGKDENMLGNTFACKRLEILQVGFAQAAAAAFNHTLEKLDAKVSKYIAGNPIRIDGKPRASGVLDTVRAAVANGVKVPAEFEDKAIINVIERAVVKEWFEGYKTEEVRRLGMGRLLDDLAKKMQRKAEKGPEDPLKILVHSTHDTAIAALCSTLDVFDDKWPAFTSAITFELFRKAKNEDEAEGTPPPTYMQNVLGTLRHPNTSGAGHYVRMRYQNRNMVLPICAEEGKHLPGSAEFCTLEAFRDRVKELTPEDWDAECAPGGRPA